jgi:pyridoxine 4-dehydrogenase
MSVTILDKEVGLIGYGLMGLTWRPPHLLPSTQQAFTAMSAALASGANLWNGGENYGPPSRNSLHLLAEYFDKYPEAADKVLLSIKGGFARKTYQPDGSAAGVRRSVDECNRILGGRKKVDIWECARVDPNTPIEDTVKALAELVKEGLIGGIGLSEVKASTIRRAAKVHPIAAVEVELSIWATDILHNGVAEACAELGIPIVAYSPLSHGMLTGEAPKRNADVPENLRGFPKFQDDVLQENMKLTEEVEKLAKQKGVTVAQVAIAWVKGMSGRGGLGVIVPIPGATTEARVLENTKDVRLTEEEMQEIDEILKKNKVVGERYGGPAAKLSEG